MEDHPDPRLSPIFHLVFGLPVAVLGLVGAIWWYHQVNSNVADVPGASPMGLIGPVILGFFSVMILIWVMLGAVSIIFNIKE